MGGAFSIAFSNVLLTLLYIIPGFLCRKTKVAKAEHLSTLSAILVYVCSPCMVVNSFMKIDRSVQMIGQILLFFLVSLVIQTVLTFVLYGIFRKKFHDVKYRMLTVSFGLGNAGFFGIPIINALIPNRPEVACFACVYIVGMNMLTFTIGAYCLTGDKKRMTLKKAFLNPPFISLLVALLLYALNFQSVMPSLLGEENLIGDALELLSKTTTPICMIILGIRLASVSFKKLFTRLYVYIICACKLLIFPFVCLAIVYFLPSNIFGDVFKAAMFILGGTPCAAVMLNIAEMYDGETELAANCVLLSTLLCVFTIPFLNVVTDALFKFV
ncbi:MAG: AEC family transporter [Clostridia bacterium]|nr:AEC family transporter [Clostridia bacterium]